MVRLVNHLGYNKTNKIMKNKFEINEEEKNRIRGLHSINEQWTEVEMEGEPQEEVNTMAGGSGFSEKQGDSDSLSRFNERQDVEEQSTTDDEPPHGLQKYEGDHEKFMTDLHSMCGQIEDMGNKMIGRRKCDGNKTDGSGGCYEPLIKLVKEYCKTK